MLTGLFKLLIITTNVVFKRNAFKGQLCHPSHTESIKDTLNHTNCSLFTFAFGEIPAQTQFSKCVPHWYFPRHYILSKSSYCVSLKQTLAPSCLAKSSMEVFFFKVLQLQTCRLAHIQRMKKLFWDQHLWHIFASHLSSPIENIITEQIISSERC